MAMETLFSTWAIIDRPIMHVFNYAANPKNILQWFPFYSATEPLVKKDDSVVSSFRATIAARPFRFKPSIDVDLVELIPGRRISYRCLEVAMIATVDFEPSSKGTIISVTVSLWSWPALFFSYFVQPFRPLINDVLTQVLLSLKRHLEGMEIRPDPLVFFSYRRAQAKYVGGRIYDALCQEFGVGCVFRDMDSIAGGAQWYKGIREALSNCRIVVAHIDDDWEDEIKRRADHRTRDVLREELEEALCQGTTIVPVFTSVRNDFSISARQQRLHEKLPEGVIKKALAECQGLLLRTDPDFRHDLDKVIRAIWEAIRSKPPTPTLTRSPSS